MNPVKVIYLKEIREMLRDKRVRSSALFGPMIMVSMIMFMFGFLITAMSEPSSQKIHIVKTDNSLVRQMRDKKMDVKEVASLEEGREMVRDGRARVVLKFEDDFDQRLASGHTTTVVALFNPTEQVSLIAMETFRHAFERASEQSRNTILLSKGITPEQVEPLKLKTEEVKTGKAKTNDVLVGFLPYLIVIWAFYGGMSIVTELVAGEKEKNTLETLMISPVKRTQIALGKFFALSTVCFTSSVSALAGVYLMAGLHLPMTKKLFEQGVGLSPEASGVILLVMAPTVALLASLMLAVSTYARNARESQSHLTLISFIVLMPALASQFIGFTDAGSSKWVNWVPILNAANTIRHAMFGTFDWPGILVTVFISLVLALLAMAAAIALFNREEVLTRV